MQADTTSDSKVPARSVHAVKTLDSVPRPPLGSLVGWIALLTKPEFARREMTKLGERVVLDVPAMPTLLVTTSVEDCRAILTEYDGTLEFNEALRRLSPHERVIGREMLDWFGGDMHARVRQTVMPAFKGNAIRGYEQAMIDATRKRVGSWPVGEAVSFYALMKDLARDVIVSVVFGVTDPDRTRRLVAALRDFDKLLLSPGMMSRYALSLITRRHWLPFPALDRTIAEIDAVIYDELAYRRTHRVNDGKDCLSIFLRIQKEQGRDGFLDDHMIAAFMRLLLLAGYETTGTTLAWVAERLTRHPAVLAKTEQTLAAGDDSYLDAVIAEAMRVRPAVPFTVRSVEKTCVMNDLLLPAGTLVAVYINALHKRADLYPEPEAFNPDRFAAKRPDTRHWMPFGGGAHYCLGAQFALFESRVLLRTILQERTFAVSTAADEPQDQRVGVTILPGHGAMVTLLDRKSAAAKHATV